MAGFYSDWLQLSFKQLLKIANCCAVQFKYLSIVGTSLERKLVVRGRGDLAAGTVGTTVALGFCPSQSQAALASLTPGLIFNRSSMSLI